MYTEEIKILEEFAQKTDGLNLTGGCAIWSSSDRRASLAEFNANILRDAAAGKDIWSKGDVAAALKMAAELAA